MSKRLLGILSLLLFLVITTSIRGGPVLQLPKSPAPLVRISAAIPANLPQLDAASVRRFHSHSFILANDSDQAIVGLLVRWTFVDGDGQTVTHDVATDSYKTTRQISVVPPHDRLLVAPGTFVLESLAQAPHIGNGIETMDGRIDAGISNDAAVTIKVDSIIFENGDVFGANEFGYDTEIEDRKLAATELANQIRKAEAKGDDLDTVFVNILETKASVNDFVAKWRSIYARSLQRKSTASFETRLRTMENLPEPPKFNRK